VLVERQLHLKLKAKNVSIIELILLLELGIDLSSLLNRFDCLCSWWYSLACLVNLMDMAGCVSKTLIIT